MYRDYIKSEDLLRSSRTAAFLTIQGLLFAALGVTLGMRTGQNEFVLDRVTFADFFLLESRAAKSRYITCLAYNMSWAYSSTRPAALAHGRTPLATARESSTQPAEPRCRGPGPRSVPHCKPLRLCVVYCNFTAISLRRAFPCIGNPAAVELHELETVRIVQPSTLEIPCQRKFNGTRILSIVIEERFALKQPAKVRQPASFLSRARRAARRVF
jgi:hypothetical protein